MPYFAVCSSRSGEVAAGGAVVGLNLVKEHVELADGPGAGSSPRPIAACSRS